MAAQDTASYGLGVPQRWGRFLAVTSIAAHHDWSPAQTNAAGHKRPHVYAATCVRKRRPTEAASHIKTMVSPIPTRAYKPATVTPRQTSAMTLSGWSVISLSGIELLHAIDQPT